MENPIPGESYQETKRKAKEFYDSIGRIWCPALNDFVHFGRVGFNHLSWQGSKPRRRLEQLRRFAVLPYVPQILTTTTKISEYRTTLGKSSTTKWHHAKTNMTTAANFWGFSGNAEEKNVRIIVRKIGNGNKHFFSVFEAGKAKRASDGQF